MITDIDVLARTIYGEARGEYYLVNGGLSSLIAVGNVVMNRLIIGEPYGRTIQEVCQKPWQFSCWNKDDPNRRILVNIKIKNSLFAVCFDVAQKVVMGQWPDLTKKSDHYHATNLQPYPTWTKGRKPKVHIGGHFFYQLTTGE